VIADILLGVGVILAVVAGAYVFMAGRR